MDSRRSLPRTPIRGGNDKGVQDDILGVQGDKSVLGEQSGQEVLAELSKRITRIEVDLASQGLTLQESGPQLIRNPSFESNSTGQPTYFSYINNSTSANTFVNNAKVRSGNHALRIQPKDDKSSFGVYQPSVSTVFGRPYTLSLYISNQTGGDVRLQLSFWDRLNNRKVQPQTFVIPGIDRGSINILDSRLPAGRHGRRGNDTARGWQKVSYTFNPNSDISLGNNYYPMIEVLGASSGNVYIDDLYLTDDSGSAIFETSSSAGVGLGSLVVDANGNIYPYTSGTGSLGIDSNRFTALYLSKGSIDKDGNMSLSGTLDVSGASTLSGALSVGGATTLNGNTTLGDASSDTLTFTGRAASNFIPTTNQTYDLGSSSLEWNNLYAKTLNISGGQSIGGNLTVTGTLGVTGATTLSSTLSVTGAITAPTSTNTINSLIINSGALSGVTSITTSGGYTQSGTTANTFTGTSTFSNATYSALFTGGNVGIGTATPTYGLQVQGTAYVSNNLTLGNALIPASNPFTIAPSYTTLYSPPNYTGGLERVTWNNSGFTYTVNSSFATQRFYLYGQSAITAGTALGVTTEADTLNIAGAPISAGSATIANSVALKISSGTSVASGVTNAFGLYVEAPTGATNNYAAVFTGGNVGIGTTAPGVKLEVSGSIRASSTIIGETSGSGAAPSIYFNGDSDTGFWHYPSIDNSIAFSAGGTTYMILGTNGVPEEIRLRSNSFIRWSEGSPENSAGTVQIGRPAANSLAFTTNSSERVRIDATGNVGIGTISPAALLQVGTNTDATTNTRMKVIGYSDTNPLIDLGDGTGAVYSRIQRTSGNTWNYTWKTVPIGETVNWSGLGLNITASNNLGGNVPTISTFGMLNSTVNGDAGTQANYYAARFMRPTLVGNSATMTVTTAATVYIENAPTASTNAAISNAYALYSAAGTNYFGGNVGIGTTAPAAPLEVKAAGTGVIAKFTSANTTGCTLADGGTISCSSDRNLKKNIEELPYGLDTLMALNPVEFNWNSQAEGTTKSLGFIAQDVETVVPNLVTTDSSTGHKQLNTIGLVPVLAKALQDLNQRVNGINTENVIARSEERATKQSSSEILKQVQDDIKELEASISAVIANSSQTSSWGSLAVLSATSSALLTSTDNTTNAENLLVGDTLSVLGRTILSDLGVTGNINAGLLYISGIDGEINTLAGNLRLQSNGLNGLDILAGKIVIDNKGNITSSADLSAKTVSVDELKVSSQTLGKDTIKKGDVLKTILTDKVASDSSVFVTPLTKTDKVLSVDNILEKKSFDVVISSPWDKDIRFNWWIVGTK